MKKGYSNTIEEENLEDSMEAIDPEHINPIIIDQLSSSNGI